MMPNINWQLIVLLQAAILVAIWPVSVIGDEQNGAEIRNANGNGYGNTHKDDYDDLLMAPKGRQTRDLKWPNRQLNVLVDLKSFNRTEQQVLAAMFDQIEHKTCLKVERMAADSVNPFDTRSLPAELRNFVYIFKSQFGSHNRQPSIGLSSLGCIHQGRQSMVLTDLAFRLPEVVLRYHILRTLGVDSVERPDGQVRKLLNILPLSQKITSREEGDNRQQSSKNDDFNPAPAYFAYASPEVTNKVEYLHEEDLNKIKQLYGCSELQNRLSVKPIQALDNPNGNSYTPSQQTDAKSIKPTATASSPPMSSGQQRKLDVAEESIRDIFTAFETNKDHKVDEKLIDNAAKHIVDYLLSSDEDAKSQAVDSTTTQSPMAATTTPQPPTTTTTTTLPPATIQCSAADSCPAPVEGQERSTTPQQQQQERPMLLKLDDFHAQDPGLQQANQIKLSQMTNDSLATYRLMDAPEWGQMQQYQTNYNQQQPQQQQQQQQQQQWNPPKSEMLISFEQSGNPQPGNPLAALASSQVLKLCSCQCQTMAPRQPPNQQSTHQPVITTQDTHLPQTTDERPPMPTTTELPDVTVYPTYQPTTFTDGPYPPYTIPTDRQPPTQSSTLPITEIPVPPTSTTMQPTPKTTEPPISTTPEIPITTRFPIPTTSELPMTTYPQIPTSIPTSTERPSSDAPSSQSPVPTTSYCNLVEWVQPNKTVYASARIVWDVDRANQNYFLCNNIINGELVPGKTHGFSCKISSEGKSYEMHNFSVLTKPENVNLAWVQRNSDSFGKTNFPVIGGFSKNRDPYIVSRCLVRDENNDVITLIGYVNSHGNGWFPFDDIQIECAQYDVLACVN